MLLSFRRWLQFCQTFWQPIPLRMRLFHWHTRMGTVPPCHYPWHLRWSGTFPCSPSMAVRISSFGILEAGFLVFGFVVTSLVLISFISHLQSRSVLLLRFARLGRHQTVQLCISWERIFKRHQIPGAADQTVSGTHIGDVG